MPCGGSIAEAVNDVGHVAGVSSSLFDIYASEAFFWSPESGMIGLGDLPGGAYWSWGRGINDLGQVVGTSRQALGQEAFIWNAQDGMRGLGDLPGEEFNSSAYDINNHGQVVGWSVSQEVPFGEAFIWDALNGMRPLGPIPGGGFCYGAVAINDNGVVLGTAFTSNGEEPVLWSESEGFRLLGLAPDTGRAGGRALNDHNVVVGYGRDDEGPSPGWPRAFVWDERHGMRLIDPLIDPCADPFYLPLAGATGINSAGQITALPLYPDEAVLLTPYLPGDLDDDGDVDVADLGVLLAHFGSSAGAGYAEGDVQGCDADVDLHDLTVLLSNFGQTPP
jgi:probable HAF family extracellular repeat protein